MNQVSADKIHYLRIPQALGGRAEMVRLVYVLSGRPYVDVFHARSEAAQAVTGNNPFKQFPFVETSSGARIYQTIAIMHHAAHGTSAWPSDPNRLTDALAVAMGGYDLYQAFGGFAADDAVAKKRFEERRAPQLFGALDEIYATRAFAAGDVPTFADAIVHESVAWCVRRNEVCRNLLETKAALGALLTRFTAVPAIRDFRARQTAARLNDDSV
jgi:glutathione S-transferase